VLILWMLRVRNRQRVDSEEILILLIAFVIFFIHFFNKTIY
jgi:hypothetical protein